MKDTSRRGKACWDRSSKDIHKDRERSVAFPSGTSDSLHFE